MQDKEQRMSAALVRIFENVLLTEELSLSQGYFSDLSIAEMHTLTAIGPYEAKTMTNTAAILGITTGTLTVAIDRLVKKGYVERRRDSTDERVLNVSATETGLGLREKALAVPDKIACTLELNGEERALLCTILHKLLGE